MLTANHHDGKGICSMTNYEIIDELEGLINKFKSNIRPVGNDNCVNSIMIRNSGFEKCIDIVENRINELKDDDIPEEVYLEFKNIVDELNYIDENIDSIESQLLKDYLPNHKKYDKNNKAESDISEINTIIKRYSGYIESWKIAAKKYYDLIVKYDHAGEDQMTTMMDCLHMTEIAYKQNLYMLNEFICRKFDDIPLLQATNSRTEFYQICTDILNEAEEK